VITPGPTRADLLAQETSTGSRSPRKRPGTDPAARTEQRGKTRITGRWRTGRAFLDRGGSHDPANSHRLEFSARQPVSAGDSVQGNPNRAGRAWRRGEIRTQHTWATRRHRTCSTRSSSPRCSLGQIQSVKFKPTLHSNVTCLVTRGTSKI
jgi:hypothetical protein